MVHMPTTFGQPGGPDPVAAGRAGGTKSRRKSVLQGILKALDDDATFKDVVVAYVDALKNGDQAAFSKLFDREDGPVTKRVDADVNVAGGVNIVLGDEATLENAPELPEGGE